MVNLRAGTLAPAFMYPGWQNREAGKPFRHPVNSWLMTSSNREAHQVTIVPYEDTYQHYFKSLNMAWIQQYFKMEPLDYKALDHPRDSILAPGGHILVALLEGEPVGVCALIKSQQPEYDYELAKMGVSLEVRGQGIGKMLGKAVIEKSRSLGARKIFLESNTVLEPAIALYRQLGFREVTARPSPYKRSNIQMELIL